MLVHLPDHVLPYLNQPLLLADFLSDAYSAGGQSGVLALQSLFLLITKHNFDYPEFYDKLYILLSDETLLVREKYRSRFFHLLELFLSSSHLPVYLIAAFAKR